MTSQRERAVRFRALHHGDGPLLLPNPWDVGSAKVLATLGFQALATTSAGFAGTLGRRDGRVTRDEAIEHSRVIVGATDLPVSADLEGGFADDPDGVAETVRQAIGAGLAGCSIEDAAGHGNGAIYDHGLAVERVIAAVEAARSTDEFVLTARAENFLHGRSDLADTIARLQAFQEAGADVLYAPGVASADDIRAIVTSVDRPVNVLALPGAPTVAELGAIGVARISVGSGFSNVAIGALVAAGRELLETGTYDFWKTAGVGMTMARQAFDA